MNTDEIKELLQAIKEELYTNADKAICAYISKSSPNYKIIYKFLKEDKKNK